MRIPPDFFHILRRLFVAGVLCACPVIAFASTGTIASTTAAAWSDQIGWVNFAPAQGGVTVGDATLGGSAWSANYGWINFAPSNGGVTNDGEGHLGGSAWGDNLGWISFSGVTISTTTGRFSGTATGTVIGTLTFDCTECNVTTDWRPAAATSSPAISTPPAAGGSPAPSPSPTPTPTPAPTPSPQPQSQPQPTPVPSPSPNPTLAPTPSANPSSPSGPAASGGSSAPAAAGGSAGSAAGGPLQAVSSFVSSVVGGVVANAAPVVRQAVAAAKRIIETPAGSVATKAVSTVGVLIGLSLPATVAATSFSDAWLMLGRMLGFFLEALSIRRKSRPWGTVYDSVTKRPLDPVYVSLIDAATGAEAASAITDIDGRYGFLVRPGTYRIAATKTDYAMPSTKMLGRAFDEVYNDLYFGDDIVVTEQDAAITKNIPMDPQSFNWNEFAKTRMRVNKFVRGRDVAWARFSKAAFFIGAIVALVAVFVAPVPYNFIIAAFYALAYALNYVVFAPKKSGMLREASTGLPLSFALVRIFREGENEPFTKRVATATGAYYALVPNGRYFMTIEKKNDDETYVPVSTTPVFDVERGIINADIEA